MSDSFDKVCRKFLSLEKKQGSLLDRFIPSRGRVVDNDLNMFLLLHGECTEPKSEYQLALSAEMFDGGVRRNILPIAKPNSQFLMQQIVESESWKRVFKTKPERKYAAPQYINNFSYHQIDWSTLNIVMVGLTYEVFLLNAETNEITQLWTTEEICVTCVKWSNDGKLIAVGLEDGSTFIFDASSMKLLRKLKSHGTEVLSISWNGRCLSTGSGDTTIHIHDLRERRHLKSILKGHTQEVCCVIYNEAGTLLASGGGDGIVFVWKSDDSHIRFEGHEGAAVKAIAWCPWNEDILATGGGSADGTIKYLNKYQLTTFRFWDVVLKNCIKILDCSAQVTSVNFSKKSCYREIVVGHGYPHNGLKVWKYPSLELVADIKPETDSRVLDACLSPDGATILTASADETLRFWKVFEEPPKKSKNSSTTSYKMR